MFGKQWIGYDFQNRRQRTLISFRNEYISIRFKTERSNGLLFASGDDVMMVHSTFDVFRMKLLYSKMVYKYR